MYTLNSSVNECLGRKKAKDVANIEIHYWDKKKTKMTRTQSARIVAL